MLCWQRNSSEVHICIHTREFTLEEPWGRALLPGSAPVGLLEKGTKALTLQFQWILVRNASNLNSSMTN